MVNTRVEAMNKWCAVLCFAEKFLDGVTVTVDLRSIPKVENGVAPLTP